MPTPEELRKRIRDLERELGTAKAHLHCAEQSCTHDWTAAEYTPERREAYTVRGDPPGTMGVDWRPDVYVPAEIIPKWTRRCRKCSKIESTTRSEKVSTNKPIF